MRRREVNKYLRIIEKRGQTLLVDLDGNIIPPAEAQQLAQIVHQSAKGKTYVYFGHRQSDGLYKVGWSANPVQRCADLHIAPVHLVECEPYGDLSGEKIESALHDFFADDQVEGEWYRLMPSDIGLIQSHCKDAQQTLSYIHDLNLAWDKTSTFVEEHGAQRLMAELVIHRLYGERMSVPDYEVAYTWIQKHTWWATQDGNINAASVGNSFLRMMLAIGDILKNQ